MRLDKFIKHLQDIQKKTKRNPLVVTADCIDVVKPVSLDDGTMVVITDEKPEDMDRL